MNSCGYPRTLVFCGNNAMLRIEVRNMRRVAQHLNQAKMNIYVCMCTDRISRFNTTRDKVVGQYFGKIRRCNYQSKVVRCMIQLLFLFKNILKLALKPALKYHFSFYH